MATGLYDALGEESRTRTGAESGGVGLELAPRTVIGQFSILRPLGHGGLGEVYLARDLVLGRLVALKFMRTVGHGPEAVASLMNEARLTAQLNHPNIVTLYGVGEYEGVPFVVLEYVEGASLSDRLREDALGVRESVRVVLGIARAIAAAHAGGVLHRDLKPSNVVTAADGRVRVLDFGIAKFLGGGTTGPGGDSRDKRSSDRPPSDRAAPFNESKINGTPPYMAPEQWRGKDAPSIDISAIGVTQLVSGGYDKVVRVWAVDGKTPPVELRGATEFVLSVAFSGDGQHVAAGSADRLVRIYRADGIGDPFILGGHTEAVYSVAFSPNGEILASSSADKSVRIWRAHPSHEPLVFSGHGDTVYSVAWSPDGKHIASGSNDETIRIWNEDGTGRPLVAKGHTAAVYAVAFSADGTHIASASFDKTLRLWNADGQGEPRVMTGHTDRLSALAFSPDGRWLVSAATDKTLRLWNADGSGEGRILFTSSEALAGVGFSPDSRRCSGDTRTTSKPQSLAPTAGASPLPRATKRSASFRQTAAATPRCSADTWSMSNRLPSPPTAGALPQAPMTSWFACGTTSNLSACVTLAYGRRRRIACRKRSTRRCSAFRRTPRVKAARRALGASRRCTVRRNRKMSP